MNDDAKKSIFLGVQEQGCHQRHKLDYSNQQSNKDHKFEQINDQCFKFEQINDQCFESDQEDYNLLQEMKNQSSDEHMLDFQQELDTCEDQQIFDSKFQICHPAACILICNCINQNTKANIKAVLSKGENYILVSELQNNTEQYNKKYKENLIRIVGNFIIQNTPSEELIDSKNKLLIELEKNQMDIKDDISDNIFNNIDMLRREIKELNKLM